MNQPPSLPPPPQSSALAIWSLVLGILSLTCFWVFTAIPAVICGHLAHSRIKASAGRLDGAGLALAGMITGYVSIALSFVVVPMLFAIAIPNFVKARSTAQRNACVNNLRIIDGAKQQWSLENKKEPTDTPTAQELSPFIPGGFGSLSCPAQGRYTINKVETEPTCSVSGHNL